jgi:hypothetical protein
LVDPTLAFFGEEFPILPKLSHGVGRGLGRFVSSAISAAVIQMSGFFLFPGIQVVRALVSRTLVLHGVIAGGGNVARGLLIGTNRLIFLPFPVSAIYLQCKIVKLGKALVPRKMH